MDEPVILILPEAEAFLETLPEVLVDKDYYSWVESAKRLVEDILNFIQKIPYMPHYTLTEKSKGYFNKYGIDLYYAFLVRKSSPATTWYVFFSKSGNRYLIRYITNNHKDGAYIR